MIMPEDIEHTFEMILSILDKPLYDELEVGFRHGPLTMREERDRYASACHSAATTIRWLKERWPNG